MKTCFRSLLYLTSFIFFISNVSVAAAEDLQILTCDVIGSQKHGDNPRTMTLTIIPPSNDERGYLWHLDQDNNPGHVLVFGSAVGEIQVDYGSYTERRDLIFINVGNSDGSSHKAFWIRSGVMQHPSFLSINIWDEDIPIYLMDTSQAQPMLTGNCSR